MEEATNNFCAIVDNTIKLLQAACPKMGSHPWDASDFAYWQWSSSYFTKLPALGLNKESVVEIDNNTLGYPEINYFKNKEFIPTLKNKSSTHKDDFEDTNFGSPKSDVNYAHLFYLPKNNYTGDMPKSSLFNLDTVQDVFYKIEGDLPDIYENPNITVNFTKLHNYTEALELDDDKQTYLLFIWMKQMLKKTVMRTDEGGDYFTTNIMGLAQDSMKGALNWMSKEFPAYLYGNLMATSNEKNCEDNVKAYIREVEEDQVPKFCNDTKLDMVSAESYSFYASIYFTRDYKKMQYVYDTTGISEQAMAGLLKHGYYLERNLMKAMKKVKKTYNDTICND